MLSNTPIAGAAIASIGTTQHVFNVVSGTFTLSMHGAAKLITNVKETGVFTYTGQPVTITKAMNVDLASGSFATTFNDATLIEGKRFSVDSGSFTYTGQDVSIQFAVSVDIDSGTFTITDRDASVTAQLNMDADSGTFTYTGRPITKLITEVVDAGSMIVTGKRTRIRIHV